MYSTAIDRAPAVYKVNSENASFFCFCILEFQTLLEAEMDKKLPALVLVPVTHLPWGEIIQVACWLST